jgi:cell division initiation protein
VTEYIIKGVVMKLSPLNIKRQEFSKKMKGYDVNEVAAFLERIADEVDNLQKDNEELKNNLEAANNKIAEFRKIEKNLQDTLLKAQETSAKSMEAAKKQTALMLREAEVKSQQMVDKARNYASEIKNSVEVIKQEKDILIAKLKSIVNSQISFLDKTFNEPEEQPENVKRVEVQQSVDIDINDIINKISE